MYDAARRAWFGSFGYNSWAGVGEAVPRSVLHEISHSYWGAFSVEGRPDLSWDTSNGTSEALTAFRHDLDAFMLQHFYFMMCEFKQKEICSKFNL